MLGVADLVQDDAARHHAARPGDECQLMSATERVTKSVDLVAWQNHDRATLDCRTTAVASATARLDRATARHVGRVPRMPPIAGRRPAAAGVIPPLTPPAAGEIRIRTIE
jgi:hypothetical protein